MSRLVIFGDSFAAERPDSEAWPKLLAEKYGVPAKYYSFPATNIEYTSIKLFQYLETDYKEDDIIVLVLTSSARAPIVHDDYYPSWAPMYKFSLLDPDFLENLGNKHVTQHMNEHKQYYETWQRYFNPLIHQSTCYFITKTVNSLPNKKLVLSGFSDSDPKITKTAIDCHPGGNLFDISCLEYEDNYTVEGFRGRDKRANHLSPENHYIMLDYVYSCLENGCTDLDYSKFKQAFYTRKS